MLEFLNNSISIAAFLFSKLLFVIVPYSSIVLLHFLSLKVCKLSSWELSQTLLCCYSCFSVYTYIYGLKFRVYNWKAPHKKQASDKMCSICTLKRQKYLPFLKHVILRKARRNRPHKNKANVICLVFV